MRTGLTLVPLAVVGALVVPVVALRKQHEGARGHAATNGHAGSSPEPVITVLPPPAPLPVPAERPNGSREWTAYRMTDGDGFEDEFAAGTVDYMWAGRHAGFSDALLARGDRIRTWYPCWRPGQSSFIYHYTDLLDADGQLLAQAVEPENIGD